MGDAVFCGKEFLAESENIFIVWGDQVYISGETINKALTIQRAAASPCCTLPILEVDNPYVQYILRTA
jgi:UTP-glucose-1-phosphate uridylyltransferase